MTLLTLGLCTLLSLGVFAAIFLTGARAAARTALPPPTWGAPPGPEAGPVAVLRRSFLAREATPPGAAGSDDTALVLVDFARGGDAITLLVSVDGSASLYTSRGGGMMGMGGVPAVRAAGEALLAAEAEARTSFDQPVPDGFPYPSDLAVAFWRVTPSSTSTTGPVSVAEVGRPGHPLAKLADAAMRTVDAMQANRPDAKAKPA